MVYIKPLTVNLPMVYIKPLTSNLPMVYIKPLTVNIPMVNIKPLTSNLLMVYIKPLTSKSSLWLQSSSGARQQVTYETTDTNKKAGWLEKTLSNSLSHSSLVSTSENRVSNRGHTYSWRRERGDRGY
jgi:hypothetical protein